MGGHDTYMHKEMSEQAEAVDRVLRGRIDDRFSTVHLGGLNLDAREARGVRRIKILGCGTSYHAGLIGAASSRSWPASPPTPSRPRSSATATRSWTPTPCTSRSPSRVRRYDVLAAVQELKRKGARVLGVGERGRLRDRPRGGRRHLRARRPGGLRRLDQVLHQQRSSPSRCSPCTSAGSATCRSADGKRIIEGLRKLPGQIEEILAMEPEIEKLARSTPAPSR